MQKDGVISNVSERQYSWWFDLHPYPSSEKCKSIKSLRRRRWLRGRGDSFVSSVLTDKPPEPCTQLTQTSCRLF